MSMTPEQLVIAARAHRKPPVNGHSTPSLKLATYIDGVTSGKIRRVPLPWPKLDVLTYAMMPGAMTVLCGDPGVGKTYWLLDCLRKWVGDQVDTAIHFLEEDDTFYLRRLLAQEEGKAEYGRLDWWVENPNEVRAAMLAHASVIDRLGACFKVATDLKQMHLKQISMWLDNELKNGRRIVAIDPITAANAGLERWLADDAFTMECKGLLSRYGGSLLLVTHSRKGNVTKKSGHDMALGAAYFRFSSTTLWLNKLSHVKRFDVYGEHGPTTVDTDIVIEIHKARESKGTGQTIAMKFGDGLHYSEAGVVLRESDEAPEGQHEKPMTRDQVKGTIQRITKLYPLKLNEAQGDQLKKAFSRVSFAAAERAIDAYYRGDSTNLDVSNLLGCLNA